MTTLEHYHLTRENLKTAMILGLLAGAFLFVGTFDYEEELRLEAAREERAASLAASFCLPRPGQETRWVWKRPDGTDLVRTRAPLPAAEQLRLSCQVIDNAGYGRGSSVVLEASPAGLDRLALFQGGGR